MTLKAMSGQMSSSQKGWRHKLVKSGVAESESDLCVPAHPRPATVVRADDVVPVRETTKREHHGATTVSAQAPPIFVFKKGD